MDGEILKIMLGYMGGTVVTVVGLAKFALTIMEKRAEKIEEGNKQFSESMVKAQAESSRQMHERFNHMEELIMNQLQELRLGVTASANAVLQVAETQRILAENSKDQTKLMIEMNHNVKEVRADNAKRPA